MSPPHYLITFSNGLSTRLYVETKREALIYASFSAKLNHCIWHRVLPVGQKL